MPSTASIWRCSPARCTVCWDPAVPARPPRSGYCSVLRPGGGTATVLGQDPWRNSVSLRRRVAYVPGEVALWPGLIAATGVAVALHAVGEVRHEHSGNLLTWVSPLGWSHATRAYVDERWWPLLIGLAASVIFTACAYAAVDRRDVGSGLFPPPRGHARAAQSRSAITALAARGSASSGPRVGSGSIRAVAPPPESSVSTGRCCPHARPSTRYRLITW